MPYWSLPPLPARFTDTRGSVFVGRRHEIEILEQAWAQVEEGRRQAVFIGGEPGSGKSRLAAETAQALHDQNVAVALGTTSEDLSYPYQPLVEAIDRLLLGAQPGELSNVVDSSLSDLVRITPHLRRHSPEIPDPPATEHEYRRELFDAYALLIKRLAAQRPITLILEDLHWSSAPTRLLLRHVIESVEDVPLLVLGTMRNTPPDRSDDLAFVIADLYRLPGVKRVDLVGLDAEDIETYLSRQGAGDRLHLREAAMLLKDQTGGNPLFLQELWGELAKSGGVQALRSGTIAPTRTVRDTIERRLRHLSAPTRRMLHLAAILGDSFDIHDLAQAGSTSRSEVLRALDEAVEGELLSVEPDSGEFAFRHVLVRHTILGGLSPSDSAAMHAQLAQAVEGRYESHPQLAPLLARLFGGARALGYEDEIAHYNAQAARQAERGLAHEEAAVFWERAADSISDARDCEEMLLSAAQSHMLAGEFADARRICELVFASPDDNIALKAAIAFEDASWRPGLNGAKAVEMLSSSVDRVGADPADPLYVSALAALGRAHTFAGEMDEAVPITEKALTLARDQGDEQLVASALNATLFGTGFWYIPGPSELAAETADELRKLSLKRRDYDQLALASTYACFSAYMLGDAEWWLSGRADLGMAATKTGQPFWAWVKGCSEYCQHFVRGDFDVAEELAEKARDIGYSFGADDTEGTYGIQMFMIHRATGHLESIRSLLSGDPDEDGSWTPGLLALYVDLGFEDPARGLLWTVLDTLDDMYKYTSVWQAVLVFLTEAAVALGDHRALETVKPLLAEYAGFNLQVGQNIVVFGSADRYLAQIAAAQDRPEEAEAYFQAALAMDTRMGSSVHRAETLALYASFLKTRDTADDRRRADDVAAEALSRAEPRGQRRVTNMLAGTQAYPDLPDGLTPREVDVLQLLVSGASNKEIGETLHISRNTAANHVRSILTKTGVPNRTAAAIYATEKGL